MRFDLVLQGGGVKGVALAGAYRSFTDAGWEPYRVAGTSAGAIVGALIAAGYDADELHEVMAGLDYRRFRQRTWLDRLGPLGELASLLLHDGVYEADALRDWLHEMLAAKGVERFADLRLDDADGLAHPWKLVVMTSDITRGELVRLPWDYPRYGLDPDEQLVADAVRCSMSIPFYFRPARLRWREHGDPLHSYLVDGGMLSNFPVDTFDRPGVPPRWPTVGVMLSARRKALAPVRNHVRGVVSLTKALIATMTGFYDQMHVHDPTVAARTVFVDTFGVSAIDFDLDAATAERLYASGRHAARRFLDGWSFDGYLAAVQRAG